MWHCTSETQQPDRREPTPQYSTSNRVSAEASVLSVAARFLHITVLRGACPLELNFGNVMYCFPEKLFPREKSLERSADWKGTCVSVSVPACALSQLQVVILSSPVIAHPLWAPAACPPHRCCKSSYMKRRKPRPLVLNWEVQCLRKIQGIEMGFFPFQIVFFFNFFYILFIYLLIIIIIFGCVGSSFLCEGFL